MEDSKRNVVLGFLIKKLEEYLDDIHAASYPHTPYDIADMSYAHWLRVYEVLQVMEKSESVDTIVEDIKAMPESTNDRWINIKLEERLVKPNEDIIS